MCFIKADVVWIESLEKLEWTVMDEVLANKKDKHLKGSRKT